MDPIVCNSCGTRFPIEGLTDDDYNTLRDQHFYEEFAEKLRILRKVQEFYNRHPEAEGLIESNVANFLKSDDPEITERRCADVLGDQIDLPPELLKQALEDTAAGEEVVEYLRLNDSSISPHLEFLSQEVARLKSSAGSVKCPTCQVGNLYVSKEEWEEFDIGNLVTWYCPSTKRFLGF